MPAGLLRAVPDHLAVALLALAAEERVSLVLLLVGPPALGLRSAAGLVGRELLRLVHVEQIDLSRVRREDFEILDHLKSNHRELYQTLKRAVRSRRNRVAPAS